MSPFLETPAQGETTQNPGISSIQGPPLPEEDFQKICRVAMDIAGLSIAPGKSAMVRTRLARRLRALKLPDFKSYCDLLEGPDRNQEITHLISALTTNVSHFFREQHHFDTLARTVLPELKKNLEQGQGIRIWSAGCANGQEPYSIAMTLAKQAIQVSQDCRILATDIDPEVVKTAKAGRYPEHMLSGLAPEDRDAYFMNGTGGYRIDPAVSGFVRFRVLNLLEPWPMKNKFDAIFCRNVVIYFDKPTQATLWRRFATTLRPGGWLFLGHSERIDPGVDHLFKKEGVTTYRLMPIPDQRMGGSA